MAKVITRLNGADYMFLDEVSMISCHELYNISARLARTFNEPNKPFSGLNILLVMENQFLSIVVALALRSIQD